MVSATVRPCVHLRYRMLIRWPSCRGLTQHRLNLKLFPKLAYVDTCSSSGQRRCIFGVAHATPMHTSPPPQPLREAAPPRLPLPCARRRRHRLARSPRDASVEARAVRGDARRVLASLGTDARESAEIALPDDRNLPTEGARRRSAGAQAGRVDAARSAPPNAARAHHDPDDHVDDPTRCRCSACQKGHP